jgi:hypothetical protein
MLAGTTCLLVGTASTREALQFARWLPGRNFGKSTLARA